MEITVYRDQPLAREARGLPAPVYNLARTLQRRSPAGVAFVPIRAMQMLAILDDEEFIFLDSQYRSWVDIAWRNFRPDQRENLEDPVAYEAVYYQPESQAAMQRLQAEFAKALQALAGKSRVGGPAKVLNFTARRPGGAAPDPAPD